MPLGRVLLASLVVAPLLAAQKAVVLGVWGAVPGSPHAEMTKEWREGAKSVKGYQWILLDEPIEELRSRPGCKQMGPACRGRISKQAGAEILFFARQFFWGVSFEQIDVKTGSQLRKAKIPMAETGDDLVARFKEMGVTFVRNSAPEPEAGAAPVAAAAPRTPPAETAKTEPQSEKPSSKPPAPALKAVVLGAWGVVPGAPHVEMTNAWREGARSVGGYEWLALDEPIEELRKRPGCAKMGPACRGRISKARGADILFFARHFFWGVSFEQIEVKTGSQLKKAKIPMAEAGDALVARFTQAGIAFIRGTAPEPVAGPVPVAAAPEPEGQAAESTTAATAEAESTVQAKPAQLLDPEISGTPQPATAAAKTDAEVEAKAAGPSLLSRLRLRTKLAAIGTGGLLVSGLVFGILARSAENDLNDPGRGCFTDAQLPRCLELERKAENRALTANILLVTGGVAAIGTGTLVYLDLRQDRAGATVAMRF